MSTPVEGGQHGFCREQDDGRRRASRRPYDLLATALGAQPARLRGMVARWRRGGLAETGRLDAGPAWCWLPPAGMQATGLGYPATRPALARLAHIRAVLAARLWLQDAPAWTQGQAW